MKKFLGTGGSSVFAAAALLSVGGSGQALAQQVQAFPVVQAILPASVTPVGGMTVPAASASTSAVVSSVSASTIAVATSVSASTSAVASSVSAVLPLAALVAANSVGADLDEEGKCLATAVYFESKGEPLEGQLAVANVVINRAKSGQYPSSWCGVVKQKAQFSFVRGGRFPHINTSSEAWNKAQSIARIAALNLTSALPQDVLWYHADYVAPSWGRRLTRASKIGAHIFYRA